MAAKLEDTILSNLFLSESYARVVTPFLLPEYFQEKSDVVILNTITTFFTKHNKLITKEILGIELRQSKELSDGDLTTAEAKVAAYKDETTNHEWLIESTEAWVKKRALYNGIIESIQIMDGKSKLTDDAIPKLLSDALAINFDSSVGHEYILDAEVRYDMYCSEEERVPFELTMLNQMTSGGMPKKTIIAVGAETGGGKSIFMTDTAAATLKQGKNVLYISMEMSEVKIAERIDAKLMNTEVDSIKHLGKGVFLDKINKISSKTQGKLFVKEYPPSAAHSGHFRGLIEELKVKQNFTPDLVIIDYLGICASSRIKMGGSVNTNTYMKSVAEELRGLAVEYNVPVLTGFQLNRNGYGNSDASLTDTADSIALQMTMDIAFVLSATEELTQMKQVIIKILKNRYGGLGKFVAGLDKAKMTFFNLEESAQTLSAPAIARTENVMPINTKVNSARYDGFKF